MFSKQRNKTEGKTGPYFADKMNSRGTELNIVSILDQDS